MSQIITIDIGNTRAKYAVFAQDDMVASGVFNPDKDDLRRLLGSCPKITQGILSSVGGKIQECMEQLHSINMTVLTTETPLPFQWGHKSDETGSDRLMAIAGSMILCPGQNNLVVDIGSCITYDILTEGQVYHAGPISPGIRLRFKSMNDYTANLPLLAPDNGNLPYLCTTTGECLQSGVLRGIEFEIKGYLDYFTRHYGNLNAIVIGGDNIFFKDRLKCCIFPEHDFSFRGLKAILDFNMKA